MLALGDLCAGGCERDTEWFAETRDRKLLRFSGPAHRSPYAAGHRFRPVAMGRRPTARWRPALGHGQSERVKDLRSPVLLAFRLDCRPRRGSTGIGRRRSRSLRGSVHCRTRRRRAGLGLLVRALHPGLGVLGCSDAARWMGYHLAISYGWNGPVGARRARPSGRSAVRRCRVPQRAEAARIRHGVGGGTGSDPNSPAPARISSSWDGSEGGGGSRPPSGTTPHPDIRALRRSVHPEERAPRHLAGHADA
jgi:hypothetical protein